MNYPAIIHGRFKVSNYELKITKSRLRFVFFCLISSSMFVMAIVGIQDEKKSAVAFQKVHEFRNNITMFHLGFEERLAGHPQHKRQELFDLLDESKKPARWIEEYLDLGPALTTDIFRQLDYISSVAGRRLDDPLRSRADTPSDKKIDSIFFDLMSITHQLRTRLDDAHVQRQERFFIFVVLTLVFFIFSGLSGARIVQKYDEEILQNNDELAKLNELNKNTIEAVTSFLKDDTSLVTFAAILDRLLIMTDSEFGFIGDIKYDSSGHPYLKTRFVSDIVWDKKSSQMYQPEGMEFRNLDSLFGHVIKTKEVMISNTPGEDKRAGGTPGGHPPLNSFLGIPLMRDKEIIGLAGVANRPGGYDTDVYRFVEPFIRTCEYVVWGVQLKDQKQYAEDRLEDFFNASTEGLIFHDQYTLLDVNHATEKLTGYSHSELVGRSILDLVSKDSVGVVSKKMLSNSKESFEAIILRKDGSTFAAEIYSTPNQTPGTQLRSASIRDISSQKQAENALNQAKKMEAVGQLTGGIAHDFNNLLSVIRGNLRFLKQDIGDKDSLKNLFDDALSAVGDGEKLTQRLLTFSRHRALHIENTNVNDAVEGFVRFLSRSLVDTMVLDCKFQDGSYFIDVDQSQLQHALLNLSFNARDAMVDGGTITYQVERTQGDQAALPKGDYICISVTDTGRGISDENLLRVYEPFFTTKAIGSGSGLGLSMVWGFVQQSQGACHIESKPGKGTSVKMYFPESRNNRIQNDSLEINRQGVVKGKYTILVVEDEHRVRRVTSRDLRNIGYSVVEAEDAAMAKSILESDEHTIDLVFSDVVMPGELDGHMLVKWIRKTYPDIKVILTSGYSIGKEVDNSIVLECPLITKPYTIDNLSEELKTALETMAPYCSL